MATTKRITNHRNAQVDTGRPAPAGSLVRIINEESRSNNCLALITEYTPAGKAPTPSRMIEWDDNYHLRLIDESGKFAGHWFGVSRQEFTVLRFGDADVVTSIN